MDVDNEHSDGGSQRPPSAEHTPQGASAQAGGASGNPTPTSVQSSNTPSTASGNAPIVTHSQNSKRRRGLGVVTPNACTECRKKRAKVRSQLVQLLLPSSVSIHGNRLCDLCMMSCLDKSRYLACNGDYQLFYMSRFHSASFALGPTLG